VGLFGFATRSPYQVDDMARMRCSAVRAITAAIGDIMFTHAASFPRWKSLVLLIISLAVGVHSGERFERIR
jgi:hypothetical protein